MAPETLAIRVRGVGRFFGPRIEMDGAASPREAFRTLLRIAGVNVREPEVDTHVTTAASGHALRDISFDVTRGSVVCLVGPSGSGKTVLLSILAGILPPTTGRIEFYAPPSALLSTHDNLDLSGSAYENLLAVPHIAQATPEDAERHITEILDFAELHGFEHAAIRTFSTGMVLRLSIAIALCGRPSIVLIDDVLNVGDIGFQQRCLDRVAALKDAGCTLVLAFSDDTMVQRLATRVITLAGGRIIGDANPLDWVTPFQQGHAADLSWEILQRFPEDDVMALRSLMVSPGGSEDEPTIELHAAFESKVDGLRCRPLMAVAAVDGGPTLFRSLYPEFVPATAGTILPFVVSVPIGLLPNGEYTLGLHVISMDGRTVHALKASNAVKLSVRRGDAAVPEKNRGPLLTPRLTWEVEPFAEASA